MSDAAMHNSQAWPPPPSGDPGSRHDSGFDPRNLLPIAGDKLTVENVSFCRSPSSPVIMVLSKDIDGRRVFVISKIVEVSMQEPFGLAIASASRDYSVIPEPVRDPGTAFAKPPPPQLIQQRRMESQAVSTSLDQAPKPPPTPLGRPASPNTGSRTTSAPCKAPPPKSAASYVPEAATRASPSSLHTRTTDVPPAKQENGGAHSSAAESQSSWDAGPSAAAWTSDNGGWHMQPWK